MLLLRELKQSGRAYTLAELVEITNRLLPLLLPADRASSKLNEEVNPRLVRNLGTLAVLDEPLRVGRESRYLYRHLLQLLVTRRLMAQGHTTGAIKTLMSGATDEELEAVLEGGARLSVAPHSSALEPQQSESIVAGPWLSEMEALFEERYAAASDRSTPVREIRPEASETGQPNAALRFLQKIREGERPSMPAAAAPAPSAAPSVLPPSSPLPSRQLAESQVTSAPPESSPAALPSQYVRVTVQPGIELHVSDEFELPPSAYERDMLLQKILGALKAIHRDKGGKKRRTR